MRVVRWIGAAVVAVVALVLVCEVEQDALTFAQLVGAAFAGVMLMVMPEA